MEDKKMEILNPKPKSIIRKKDENSKVGGRIFQDALRKAAVTEIIVEKKNSITGEKYIKRETAVERLAEQILEIALSEDTSLKDKLTIYEKMAKISEGENKQTIPVAANTTNNTLNINNMNYEDFIKLTNSGQQALGATNGIK